MKLTRDQARAFFDEIEKQINSENSKRIKAIKAENKKLREETLKRFEKTKEYSSIQMLNNSFSKINFFKGLKKKQNIQYLADQHFEVKYKSEWISPYDQIPVIMRLAADCKNSNELKATINKYYNLKKPLK
jgi:hypothetical protein